MQSKYDKISGQINEKRIREKKRIIFCLYITIPIKIENK